MYKPQRVKLNQKIEGIVQSLDQIARTRQTETELQRKDKESAKQSVHILELYHNQVENLTLKANMIINTFSNK